MKRSILIGAVTAACIFLSTPVLAVSTVPYPSPPSQEQLDKWDEMGRQNYLKYSAPGSSYNPLPKQTVETIELSETFKFEGSQSTDLANADDLKSVENFTIDTREGWKLVYQEQVDLTANEKVSALKNIDEYFDISEHHFFLKSDWNAIFEGKASLSFENENLTEFGPQLMVTDSSGEYEVADAKAEAGKISVEITGLTKAEIKPRVKLLDNDEEQADGDVQEIMAVGSHKNLDYRVKVNGKPSDAVIKDLNEQSGEFWIELNDLTEGTNQVEIFYALSDEDQKTPTEEEFILGDTKVVVVETKRIDFLSAIIAFGAVLILGGGYLGIKRFWSKK